MTQTRPKRSSAESQRSVLARCAGPVGAGARETEGDDRRGPARRWPDLPTRKTSIRRSAQNWDELGSRLRGMDSPSALAFLLMIFAGWVNRHQQIVIEFSQAENRLLKQPRRKQSWFFRTLCDATTGGHDRPGGLKFERQHLVPMRGLCSTNEVAMTVVPGLSRPLKTVGKHVGGWNEGDDCLWVDASGSVRSAACPSCSRRSSRVHGSYRRRLDDRPCFGQPVTLSVEVRRFKCVNPNCSRHTFTERLDALAAPSQRRTQRLNESLRSLRHALGGSAAARLAARLGMSTSGDTVLRELRRAGCPAPATSAVVIAIDDWAIKRGHRYGTAIVDLETRRPVEVLGGREATIVAGWLRQHPSVEIVARDRAGAYSDAARTAGEQIRWRRLVS